MILKRAAFTFKIKVFYPVTLKEVISYKFVIDVCVSWSGVPEEAAKAFVGPQPPDQQPRTEGCVHTSPPELCPQPPADCGGSGEQLSAPHAGPDSQQPH